MKLLKATICKILGHKKIYLEAMYEGEIDGWCCERCSYVHVDKQY